MSSTLVPPLKCQGIKTKLVGEISRLIDGRKLHRWVEPFCGSCVVAFNLRPKQALLADTNVHIIRLYQGVQSGFLTPALVKDFLTREGEQLRRLGERYYYAVRDRFNANPTSLDFLFLNRSCFNGVMRFNRSGKFNVPFGHKPHRFTQAYVTKITNQVRRVADVLSVSEWTFAVQDFRQTLASVGPADFVYADPPYAGRHVDYFNSWSTEDESTLAALLKKLPARFILSTWHSNEFRNNDSIQQNWSDPQFRLLARQHFYHVGSTEQFRHPMIEALITNSGAQSRHAEVGVHIGQTLS
jgi:DNA adenine methylase